MNRNTGMLLMAAVMVARGSSFIFSKWLMDSLAPMNVLAVRFIIAFVVLAIIFWKKIKAISKNELIGGALLGVCYTACMVAEMYGLRLIDAGTASFIENSAVVIVPLYVAILTRTLPKKMTVICALIAFVGVGFLTVSGGLTVNIGIILAIIAALIFGVCIIVTDKVSQTGDPITMGILQIGFMGIFSLIITWCVDKQPRLPQTGVEWGMILLLALICSCFGFTFQPLAQKYISPEMAGVFSAINPLTTCFLGILLHEEAFGIVKILGGVLIVTAVLISIFKEKEE